MSNRDDDSSISYVLFTPQYEPMTAKIDGYSGGELGRIFRERFAGQQVGILTKADILFVEGLVAARVIDSTRLLAMLKSAQSIRVTF